MVTAIELLTATRALDIRGDRSTPLLEEARTRFRSRIPPWREDCVLSIWMEEASRFLAGAPFSLLELNRLQEVVQ